jgi:hypothetical protein
MKGFLFEEFIAREMVSSPESRVPSVVNEAMPLFVSKILRGTDEVVQHVR